MRDAGHAFLKECASRRTTTSYGLVWDEVVRRLGEDLGNPWRQLPHLLGAISEVSFDESGVFATALVVYDGEGQGPGPGFFRLAAQVGLIREDDAPPAGETWTGMNPAQLAFWNSQVEAMFDR